MQLPNSFKKLAIIASFALLLVFVGAIGWLIYKNRSDLSLIAATDWRYWAAAFAAYTIVNWLKGYSVVLLLSSIGVRLPLYESYSLQNISTLTNYSLPFHGGIGFRVLYMQRVHGLVYEMFLPISIMAFIVATGIYGLLTGGAALLHGKFYSYLYQSAMAIFVAGALVLVITPVLAPYMVRHNWPMGKIIRRILRGWEIIVRDRRVFYEWVVSVILRAIMVTVVFYLACKALHINLDVWQIAVITLAKECSIIVKLTPGALGISEGVVAFFAAIYGVPVFQLIIVALGVRLVELSSSSLFGLLAYRDISQRMIDGTTKTASGHS